MKRIISVLILVCLMAGMFTLSAWADGETSSTNTRITGIDGLRARKDETKDREGFQFDFKVEEEGGTICQEKIEVQLWSNDTQLSTSTYPGKHGHPLTCNVVLYGTASSSWNTTWLTYVTDSCYPNKVVIIVDGDPNQTYMFNNLGYSNGYDDRDIFESIEDTSLQNPKRDEEPEPVPNPAPDEEPAPDKDPKPTPAPAAAANPYSVPSTADNSNMPLWGVLLIGFAAVALLTGKKRKA